MKSKISRLKKVVVIMAAFLLLSGCASMNRLAEERRWTDQRDETYFYGHKDYPCSGPERECVERAIPRGFSKLDNWIFDNL